MSTLLGGRSMPRWSVGGAPALVPEPIAKLFVKRAQVSVGPPLFWSGLTPAGTSWKSFGLRLVAPWLFPIRSYPELTNGPSRSGLLVVALLLATIMFNRL